MTEDHLRNVLTLYRERWQGAYPPVRLDTEDFYPVQDTAKAMRHAMWMCTTAIGFLDEGEIEKAFRWLGFIQGVLWCVGHYTIDEMRAHSTAPTDP